MGEYVYREERKVLYPPYGRGLVKPTKFSEDGPIFTVGPPTKSSRVLAVAAEQYNLRLRYGRAMDGFMNNNKRFQAIQLF